MRRACIILNPTARSDRARRFIRELKIVAPDAHLKLTEGPRDAGIQAKRAVDEGFDTVVAAGGDGTINEVVNGIEGAPVNLGLLPIGTINVFASELGIPWNVKKAWEIIQNGKVQKLDVAFANGHRFVQLAGVGLDAQIVQQTDRETKVALGGPLSYLLTATQIAAQKPPKLRIKVNDEVIEGSFVIVGNGRYYGGPFRMFADASMEDGLLDVCVFQRMNYIALLRYFRGIIFGVHTRFKDVKYFKTSKLVVESDDKVPVEVDGEFLGYLPCEFKIQQKKLRVIIP